MKNLFQPVLLASALLATVAAPGTASALPATSTIPTEHGPIVVTAKFHASTQIEYGGKVIIVDPLSAASWTKKADMVLITHPHPDHLDPAAIAKVVKTDALVIAPAAAAAAIQNIPHIKLESWKPGSMGLYADTPSKGKKDYLNLVVHAVPMYNLVRGPGPGKKFHAKESEWNGYVLTIGGKRLYFAGDTEVTPEMKALKEIDAAFLPMNLPFTMTPEEAAAGAKAFKPKRVYPYHYRYPYNKDSGNERKFAALMKGSSTQVILLDYYPAAAVAKATAASK